MAGQATGSVSFDGSKDVTLTVNVSRAASAANADSCGSCSYAITAGTALSANSATTAENCTGTATKARQDASGNDIAETYATKTELNNLAAKLPSFSLAINNGVLTISDGTNSWQFSGTAV